MLTALGARPRPPPWPRRAPRRPAAALPRTAPGRALHMDMQPIHSDALLHGSVVTGTARPPGFDHPRCMLESSEVQEQESLLRLLQERTATQPETTAGELLQWYQERIKESRTRLVHGSADSSESAAHLVQYAARRHDVATLQELRKHADAWEHRTRRTHSLPLPPPTDAAHPRVPLTAKIDNILFSLAARQRNWRVMCMLATSRARAQQWTPFMCRAFLRAEYAYSGNGVEDAASLECRRKLWDIFRAQFGPQLKSVDDMASDPSAELRRQSTPPWLLVFMLQMHARSGDADAALRLIQHYLESVRQTQPLPAVLRRGPSQLLTRRKQRIPGPTLLNALLHSLLRAGRPEDALFAFPGSRRSRYPKQSRRGQTLPLRLPQRTAFTSSQTRRPCSLCSVRSAQHRRPTQRTYAHASSSCAQSTGNLVSFERQGRCAELSRCSLTCA